jgi:hypothetical protein
MSIPVILQKPADERLILYQFAFARHPNLALGQRITSASITVDGDGALTLSPPTIQGSNVQVALSQGTSGQYYTLKCVAITNTGAHLLLCGTLHVTSC